MSDGTRSSKPFFVRDRLAASIGITLLVLASFAWVATYYLMPSMMMASGSGMSSGVAAMVSSISVPYVSVFEIVWVIGMVAMMFPAMMPVVLFYNKIAAEQESNPALAKVFGTSLFLSGYLVVYAILGIATYFVVYGAIELSMNFTQLAALSVLSSSAVLIVTGIYQFTFLKSRCLSNCISPIGFFALHYSRGLSGSVRMGVRHGIYCVGCCWAYMLVMLVVGAMSIPVMAVLAGVIALEKVVLKGSVWLNRGVAFGFIALGVLVAFIPGLLTIL